MPTIPVQKLKSDAEIPTQARKGDAGWDLYAAERVKIRPNKTKAAGTGVAVAIPEGYYGAVVPRSGLSLRTGLRLANTPGTIDAGYRDEVKVLIHNTDVKNKVIEKGDRIAQLILRKCEDIEWKEVEDVKAVEGDRGGGIGSTGIHGHPTSKPATSASPNNKRQTVVVKKDTSSSN